MKTGIFRSTLAEAERKKQVNKQTQAKTKERCGKQEESGNGERENRTNINDN